MKRLLSRALFIGLIVAFAAACGDDTDESVDNGDVPARATFPAGSTMASIVERGSLVVGVKYDVPLFGLMDPVSRRVDGFDVALAREIARELGLNESQVQFIEAVTPSRIDLLQDDKADLVISTMTITAARKEQIEFSRPYFLAGQSILVRKETSGITRIDDLNGKRVCSVDSSTSEITVREKAPRAVLLLLRTYSACVEAMKDGRVDAVSTDDIILAGFAAADTSLKLAGSQFTTEPYGVGVKKGKTDMAQFVTGVINEMIADGRWEKLYNQYLGNVSGLPPASEAKSKLPATS